METTISSQQPITNKPHNPLLDRIQMPGETFKLPSGGLFYTEGELDDDVSEAELHVHPMTAIDEIVMKTPDMLFSGDAVRQVFARCIPQVLNVDKLLAKDVDFLLVCLRKVSFGNEIQIEHTHTCEGAEPNTYTIDIEQFIRETKRLDPTDNKAQFTVTMPNGQEVRMRPIRFGDFVKVMQLSNIDKDTSPEELKDLMISSLSNIIVSVDEITDTNMIREWLGSVRPAFTKKINEQVESTLDWGTEFNATIACKNCGETVNVLAPMNPLSFFT